jgi:hypothetical protein
MGRLLLHGQKMASGARTVQAPSDGQNNPGPTIALTYCKQDDGSWRLFVPVLSWYTRATQERYTMSNSLPITNPPMGIRPCTLKYPSKTYRDHFIVTYSPSPLVPVKPKPIPNVSLHPYFQHMLSISNLSQIPQLSDISASIQSYSLVIIMDGSYNYETRQGSQSIALTSGLKPFWLTSGPCVELGESMSAKRSEICGIVTALYLISHICQHQNIHYGSVSILCDSKQATNVLSREHLGLFSTHPIII